MARHIWSVLCDRMFLDDQTNNVCLNVLEQVNAEIPGRELLSTPNVLLPLQWRLVSLWERDREAELSFQARLTVRAPDGKELLRLEAPGQFGDPSVVRFRGSVVGNGLPLAGSGRYSFDVEAVSESATVIVASIPLDVRVTFGDASDPTSSPG